MKAIEFVNVGKQYRLGLVSTRTFSRDLSRWWAMNVRHQDDPFLKIGETNDRSKKGESEFVWALKDINFSVEQGDVVGIIGKNGAGKSTLLKILSRVTTPTTGEINVNGRIASLLEVGTGFHPEMTGRENIYMNGAIMGMTKAEITRKLDEIVDFSGCERYLDTPVKRYSSGMTVRLGFAIAAHLEPEILVVDEVLAVGDAEFQKKAIGKMQDVSKGGGRTVLFVSHNMAAVRNLCNNGILLENGMVKYSGKIEDTIEHYLTSSEFDLKKRKCTWDVDTGKMACFTGLELIVEGKSQDQIIDMTDRIRVAIDYFVKEDISGTAIAFSLFKDGMRLFMTWDTDFLPELRKCRKKGYHRAEFYMPNNFKPGIYDTRITFGRPGMGKSLDQKDEPLQFEICNLLTDDTYMSMSRPGLLHFNIEWNDCNY